MSYFSHQWFSAFSSGGLSRRVHPHPFLLYCLLSLPIFSDDVSTHFHDDSHISPPVFLLHRDTRRLEASHKLLTFTCSGVMANFTGSTWLGHNTQIRGQMLVQTTVKRYVFLRTFKSVDSE